MSLLRLPFIRWTIFYVIILALLFTGHLGVLTFFVLGAGFSIVERYLTRKRFDKKTGNQFIDYGWIGLWLLTSVLIFIVVFH